MPSPVLRLVRREIADARRRTLAFGALAALITYIQPVSYRSTYPTVPERVRFARSFADDKAIRLFYGIPHDLLSVGGYTAWRAGSVLAVVFAVWALLTSAASLRGQEETLRTETLLALPVRRGEILAAAMAAACAQAILLVGVVFVALVAAGLPAAGSAFEAIAAGSVIPVFLGVGAVASQLEPTRRRAIELGAGCLAVMFALRVVADTAGGTGWLRSLSPLGWVEQMRAFADPRAAILLAPAVVGIALLTLALALGGRRDVGTALLSESSERPPRRWLLGSSAAFTVRSELRTLTTWLVSIAAFALIIGMISPSVTTAALSPRLRAALARVGASTLGTPAGYLGLTFLFFVVVLSLFAVAQIGAARTEELSGRVDTILAAVLGRRRWLAGRMTVAVLAAGGLAVTAALLAWAGARAAGAG
ncbi:MAG: ABC transporter permease subunit, partial [Solirubrobacteraceae bacterium]